MGLSGSGINEENHDSIGTILSIPFWPLPPCPRTNKNSHHCSWSSFKYHWTEQPSYANQPSIDKLN